MTDLQRENTSRRIVRACALVMIFLLLGLAVFLWLRHAYLSENSHMDEINSLQMALYTVGGGALVALLGTLCVKACLPFEESRPRGVWACPLAAAGLGLALMSLAYVTLGVWPVGDKSILMVDLHHQYAPLMSELRHMLIEGADFSYSFHIGLGASFLPCFAYYLASPLNLLLLFFSEAHLAEAILVITLLKNALAAAAFAACAQYLYRKRNAAVVCVSVLYSLMLYMIAYSWNIMWLDVVALLPVVVMCFERMLRERKWLGYVLTLALALFSNYYIGFMLCVFLVLYFIVWQLREPRTLSERALGTGLFAGGSLLGGGLAMALLLPTAIALGRTSAAGDAFPDFNATFEAFDVFSRLFYGATPTIRSGNLPNLYCGAVMVLLVPIYVTQQSVPLRRRVCYTLLLAVMLVSCTINQWDLVWHGLHTPNDLPYRFSFLVCFVMLLMAARVLTQLTHITPKQILGSLTAGAAYLILWEKFGGERAPDDKLLYINLLLLTVYAIALLIGATRRLPARAGRLLLLVVVTLELLFGTARTLDVMDSKEYFTLQQNYVDNDATAATAAAIERAQAIAEQAGDEFARIEYLPRSTCMDTALHHYKGITTFASSNPYNTTLFMGDFGYAINGVNSYLYRSFVAPSDSLLGIKYVILNFSLSNHRQLKLVDSLAVGSESRYIYENTTTLPVGYYATEYIYDYAGRDYAPFDNQELFYCALIGDEADVYYPLTLAIEDEKSSIRGSAFTKSSAIETGEFYSWVEEQGRYFAFVDCRAADDIDVSVYKTDGAQQNHWAVTTYEPYIIDLGELSPNQKVEVSISAEGAVSGNIHVVRLDDDELERVTQMVREHGYVVTESTDTSLTGTITAPRDGALLLSIPYDRGWMAVVDGKQAATFPVDKNEEGTDGALLAVELTAGEHTVELRYRAPGQRIGLIISVICAAVIAILCWIERKLTRKTATVATLAEPIQDNAPAEQVAEDTFTEFLMEITKTEEVSADSLTQDVPSPSESVIEESPTEQSTPPTEPIE